MAVYEDIYTYNASNLSYSGTLSGAYVLTPPTVDEGPAGYGRLFWRYKLTRGDTLLMTAGVVTRTRTPSIQEIRDADYSYMGGHSYVISPNENALLVAAGYGANIVTVP